MNKKELDTLDFITGNAWFYYQEEELTLEEWEEITSILEE